MDSLEALLRGAGQGATANWGEEGSSKLLGMLPGPTDPEGYDRTYAAGSSEKDALQKFRRDNSSAAQAHPGMYTAGQMLGAAPSSALVPGGSSLTAAGRVAAAGLAGGALGGLAGAGGATKGNRTREGAKGALLGGLLGTGAGAAMEAAPIAARALGGLRREEAMASAPGAGQVQINYERTPIVPPRRQSGPMEMVSIPKNSSPGFRESMVPKADELAEAADVVHGDKILQRPSAESDVARFAKARDEVKGLGKKPEPTSDVKTVRPPRKKVPREPVQAELPGVERNQVSAADKSNAIRRYQDAKEISSEPAVKSWVHESRSGADPHALGRLPQGNYGVAYRGMNLPEAEVQKILRSGTVPHEDISSWSVNPETAKAFAGSRSQPGKVILRQTNVRGIPVGKNEGEVLQPAAGAMKIVQASHSPEGFLNLDVAHPESSPLHMSVTKGQEQLSLDELLRKVGR